MALNLKEEYRRQSVQLPPDLDELVVGIAKKRKVSISTVILEFATRGATAEPAERMHGLYADQRALLEASHLALKAVHGPQPERQATLDKLLSHLLAAGMRRPAEYPPAPADSDLRAADPKAPYVPASVPRKKPKSGSAQQAS